MSIYVQMNLSQPKKNKTPHEDKQEVTLCYTQKKGREKKCMCKLIKAV